MAKTTAITKSAGSGSTNLSRAPLERDPIDLLDEAFGLSWDGDTEGPRKMRAINVYFSTRLKIQKFTDAGFRPNKGE